MFLMPLLAWGHAVPCMQARSRYQHCTEPGPTMKMHVCLSQEHEHVWDATHLCCVDVNSTGG